MLPRDKHPLTQICMWQAPDEISALSVLGPYFAIGCKKGAIHVVDSQTGKFVASRQLAESPIGRIAFVASGAFLPAGSGEGLHVLRVIPGASAIVVDGREFGPCLDAATCGVDVFEPDSGPEYAVYLPGPLIPGGKLSTPMAIFRMWWSDENESVSQDL